MRHYLLARPPLPLTPGMRMTAFTAVLVALGSSTLGASPGLAGTIGTAIALTAVAVAADEDRAAAAGAQKRSGWRLISWHGRSCPCVKIMMELLDSHARFVKYYMRNVALQSGGLGARQCVYLQVTGTVAPASYTGKAICNAIRCHLALAQNYCVAAFNTADFKYQNTSMMGDIHRYPNWGGCLRRPGRGLDFKNPKNSKYRKPLGSLTCQADCRHRICAVPKPC